MYKLEQRVRDKYSKVFGIITAKTVHVGGRVEYLLHPGCDAVGGFGSPQWFDEQRLVAEVDLTEEAV